MEIKVHSVMKSLNPLKQVKSFGLRKIFWMWFHQAINGLNPLKQVKSFGRSDVLQVQGKRIWSLNPLKQVKSFGLEIPVGNISKNDLS